MPQLLPLLLWAVRKQLFRDGRTAFSFGLLCRMPMMMFGSLVLVTHDTALRTSVTLTSSDDATISPLVVVLLHITPTSVSLSLVRIMTTFAALYGPSLVSALTTLARGATGQLKQLL